MSATRGIAVIVVISVGICIWISICDSLDRDKRERDKIWAMDFGTRQAIEANQDKETARDSGVAPEWSANPEGREWWRDRRQWRRDQETARQHKALVAALEKLAWNGELEEHPRRWAVLLLIVVVPITIGFWVGRRECPNCCERIKRKAKICRFCCFALNSANASN